MKRLNKKNRLFTFKRYVNGELLQSFRTRKLGRFSLNIQAGQKLQPAEKVYIKVSDGNRVNVFGKNTEFYNSGTYSDKKELVKAYKAFIE
jgi:hypothetical protein